MKDIRQQWKALSDSKSITPAAMVQLCAVRALYNHIKSSVNLEEEFRRQLKKAFSPITNARKLSHSHEYDGAFRALFESKSYEPCLMSAAAESESELQKMVALRNSVLYPVTAMWHGTGNWEGL